MAPIVNVTHEIVMYVSPRSKPSTVAGVAAILADRGADLTKSKKYDQFRDESTQRVYNHQEVGSAINTVGDVTSIRGSKGCIL